MIKQFSENGPVGVLKPCCTTTTDRMEPLAASPRVGTFPNSKPGTPLSLIGADPGQHLASDLKDMYPIRDESVCNKLYNLVTPAKLFEIRTACIRGSFSLTEIYPSTLFLRRSCAKQGRNSDHGSRIFSGVKGSIEGYGFSQRIGGGGRSRPRRPAGLLRDEQWPSGFGRDSPVGRRHG
jgi:hypothetical protein